MSPLLLPLLTGLLTGCGATGWEPTGVEDLRVITLVTEPAEALPGERVALDAFIADPATNGAEGGGVAGDDVEVMFWTCLYTDEQACAEPLFATELEEWVTVGTAAAGRFTTARQIPAEARQYFPDDVDKVSVQLFLLACREGLCPQIEQVRTAMDGVGIDPDLAEELARPDLWLADLPMDGVALATRAFPVSNRDPGIRNVNPDFDPRFAEALEDSVRVVGGGTVDLVFQCRDPNGESVYAYPLTTVGRFDDRKVKCEDDQVRLFLEAPAGATTGHAWVVFDDRDGGLAAWEGTIEVR